MQERGRATDEEAFRRRVVVEDVGGLSVAAASALEISSKHDSIAPHVFLISASLSIPQL